MRARSLKRVRCPHCDLEIHWGCDWPATEVLRRHDPTCPATAGRCEPGRVAPKNDRVQAARDAVWTRMQSEIRHRA